MNNLVSIIVPVYNSESYLRRCILSIINQTYYNLDIILINDGSSDSSLNICKEFSEKDKRITVISTKNKGASHARNIGLSSSKGQFVAFVDSDDYLEQNSIEQCVFLMQNNNDIDIVSFNWNTCYDDGRIIKTKVFDQETQIINKTELINAISLNDFAYGGGFVWNKFFRRSLIDKSNYYFDESLIFYEDKLWTIGIANNSNKVLGTNFVGYNYCIHDSSLSHSSNSSTKCVQVLKSLIKIEQTLISLGFSDSKILKFYENNKVYMLWQCYKNQIKPITLPYINKRYLSLKNRMRCCILKTHRYNL